MTVTVSRAALLHHLDVAGRVADGGTIAIQVSAQSVHILVYVPGKRYVAIIEATGTSEFEEYEVMVYTRKCRQILAKMVGERVVIAAENGELRFVDAESTAWVPAVGMAECSDTKSANDVEWFECSDMRRMIGQVIHSSSKGDLPHLSGALLEHGADHITMTTTDGHRLTQSRARCGLVFAKPIFLSLDCLLTIKSMMHVDSGVRVAFTGDAIGISCHGSEFWVSQPRRRADRYPNYRKVIPAKAIASAIVDRQALARAVALAGVWVPEWRGVALRVRGNQLVVMGNGDDGRATTAIDADVAGPAMEWSGNPKYLTDLLAVLEGERVVLSWIKSLDPIVIRQEPEDGAFGVIMPMRV